jgi:hypothetical protein
VVNELLPDISDHCSITIKLKTKYFVQLLNQKDAGLLEKPKRLKWDCSISLKFEHLIQSRQSRSFLSDLTSKPLTDQMSIDQAMSDMSSFLVTAAEQASGQGGAGFPAHVGERKSSPNWKHKTRQNPVKYPKWHDKSCMELRRQLRITSKILNKNPTNPFLKSKLLSESKDYKRLRKQKQKEFVDNLFLELDQLHKNNPRGYMNIVNSIRDGSFDKSIKDDTGHVSPLKWREHFQGLLGPPVEKNQTLEDYISDNCDLFSSELDRPFSFSEYTAAVKGLKNNKSPSFDRVSNEMLKVAHPVVGRQLLYIFNAVLATSNVPSVWKDNILTPIHKSGALDDPDNYRGIAVGSCVCKLFSKLLNKRLEVKVYSDNLVSEQQGSGKCGSRTADHLLVVKFLIDKYVNIQGGKLFVCFVDRRKCFDSIPRDLMFYSLLKDCSIGGQFLKTIKEIYNKNQIFVKVSHGICQPFETTKGVLQGETNSPLLFNIFVDKITKVFDQSCDPVSINNTPQSCLLWSDDLLLFSISAKGLQNSIDKMCLFYASLGLEISLKKTIVIIFNKSGKLLKGFTFLCNGTELEVASEYQYLGIKFTPSGSLALATDELCAKASRAWFSISNLVYTNKRMPV